jgi:hypothetical protein
MLAKLVELLDAWEKHCHVCHQCADFYGGNIQDRNDGACQEGRALIRRLLMLLQQGI